MENNRVEIYIKTISWQKASIYNISLAEIEFLKKVIDTEEVRAFDLLSEFANTKDEFFDNSETDEIIKTNGIDPTIELNVIKNGESYYYTNAYKYK